MAIVFPSEAIARRWDGALQARLRRAPLEAFLRARSLAPAAAGVAQDSDDLARATVSMVEAGLSLYIGDRVEGLAIRQRAVVGQVACLVSRALAELISQPAAWRIAALVSTARLLSPWVGLNAAAMASASYTRRFQRELARISSEPDGRIIVGACAAVNRYDAETMTELSAAIAARLSIASSTDCNWAEEDRRELSGGR
jgi:hypothetical protein